MPDKRRTMRVAFTLDVDVDAWCKEYGVAANEVPLDVTSYVTTAMHGLPAVEAGLLTICEDNPEPHPLAGKGGIHISAKQVQATWDRIRALSTEIAASEAKPPEMSTHGALARRMMLEAMISVYAELVGLRPLDAYLSLQAGHTTAPTTPARPVT